MTETAEEILARHRAKGRERLARFRERHPDYFLEYQRHRRAAEKALRDAHYDEYLAIVASLRDGGEPQKRYYRAAVAELRNRYPEEWAKLAAT